MTVHHANPGDEVVVIDDFVACRSNESFDPRSALSFTIGQRVQFLRFRPGENIPSKTYVVFAHLGQEYAAANDVFVPLDHWERLYDQVVALHANAEQLRLAREDSRHRPQEHT